MRRSLYCLILMLLSAASFAWAQGSGTTLPPFSAIEKEVAEHFQAIKDHQSQDLISRDQAAALLKRLEKLGWQVADGDEILQQLLGEGDPLVKRLRTKAGKKFMRQAARYPEAYDRLDRLERLPDGQRILKQLIEGPDGYKLIEYLAEEPGGKNMGKMLSAAPQGQKVQSADGPHLHAGAIAGPAEEELRRSAASVRGRLLDRRVIGRRQEFRVDLFDDFSCFLRGIARGVPTPDPCGSASHDFSRASRLGYARI